MSDTLCRRLQLNHIEGDILYPCRMKNQDTGLVAFRLSKGGNTKRDSIEVTDEQEMIRKVTTQGYKVRARTIEPVSQGGRTGLYTLGEQAIRDWTLND
ncbi:hypothetical protein A8C75_11650 [Marinobacterium aestuarii]|uniref:Uncharacterized protein n=1 Tax=Marinobacterium aestuarii TaxID=1821621 RepID=A0A1A9EZ03_9GAMM|nr:hypothetical protein [Marinobacterium aestuarii]ANG63062.1 hypothetical protein A8C75_11650 [Marinobacterium aestuarii]